MHDQRVRIATFHHVLTQLLAHLGYAGDIDDDVHLLALAHKVHEVVRHGHAVLTGQGDAGQIQIQICHACDLNKARLQQLLQQWCTGFSCTNHDDTKCLHECFPSVSLYGSCAVQHGCKVSCQQE